MWPVVESLAGALMSLTQGALSRRTKQEFTGTDEAETLGGLVDEFTFSAEDGQNVAYSERYGKTLLSRDGGDGKIGLKSYDRSPAPARWLSKGAPAGLFLCRRLPLYRRGQQLERHGLVRGGRRLRFLPAAGRAYFFAVACSRKITSAACFCVSESWPYSVSKAAESFSVLSA